MFLANPHYTEDFSSGTRHSTRHSTPTVPVLWTTSPRPPSMTQNSSVRRPSLTGLGWEKASPRRCHSKSIGLCMIRNYTHWNIIPELKIDRKCPLKRKFYREANQWVISGFFLALSFREGEWWPSRILSSGMIYFERCLLEIHNPGSLVSKST